MKKSALSLIALVALFIASINIWSNHKKSPQNDILLLLPERLPADDVMVWRHETGMDYVTCIRATLTIEEAEQFVSKALPNSTGNIAGEAIYGPHLCQASFWPNVFKKNMIAYVRSERLREDGIPSSASGAFLEDGKLYFWSYSL